MEGNNINSKQVWDYFRQLSSIPRCSKQEEKVCLWLKNIAEEKGLSFYQDKGGNVILKVAASKGLESLPGIILQSHVDMVCEKEETSTHDFSKDPIKLIEKDGWMFADGTSLGADNGIGVALALASIDVPHGPLELLFTVDEETGLNGANDLEEGVLKGKKLINLDSEEEGVFIVGCAGGNQIDINIPVQLEKNDPDNHNYLIKVEGLLGGHSGVNINHGRVNAIQLLTGIMTTLQNKFSFSLISLEGGTKHNAIPREAEAKISAKQQDLQKIDAYLKQNKERIQQLHKSNEPNLQINTSYYESGKDQPIYSADCGKNIVRSLNALPNGVYRFVEEVDNMVETSNNLAKAGKLNSGDKEYFHIMTSQRSSKLERLDEISDKVMSVGQLVQAKVSVCDPYSPWDPNMDSKLLTTCTDLYNELYQPKKAKVEIIHAGLECGVIGTKYPDLDMISMGPNILDPHSPKECVEIATVDKVWTFLQKLLVKP